jgi:hypothetical protein
VALVMVGCSEVAAVEDASSGTVDASESMNRDASAASRDAARAEDSGDGWIVTDGHVDSVDAETARDAETSVADADVDDARAPIDAFTLDARALDIDGGPPTDWRISTLASPARGVDFGAAVSLSFDGAVLVVGDPKGAADEHGAAAVFERTDDAWSSGIALSRGGTASFWGRFGQRVAISHDGNIAVVSDLLGSDDSGRRRVGAVATYSRTGTGWSTETFLPRPANPLSFGTIALSHDAQSLLVGDTGGADGYGAATLYTREGASFVITGDATRPAATARFGAGTAISGDGSWLVVGASGRLFGFTRTGGVLSLGVMLPLPAGDMSAYFGSVLALSEDGETLVVGDPQGANDGLGMAHVYARSGSVWTIAATLARPTRATWFGASVAISNDGNIVAVGAPGGTSCVTDQGNAMLYTRSGATWSGAEILPRPAHLSMSQPCLFGQAIALSGDGDTVAVGDPASGPSGRPGYVTVYRR